MPAVVGQYGHPHTRAWAEKIASFDAYMFVTPEDNTPRQGLKNAIAFLHAEWNNKAAGFVSYANVRANISHLRPKLPHYDHPRTRSPGSRRQKMWAGGTTIRTIQRPSPDHRSR